MRSAVLFRLFALLVVCLPCAAQDYIYATGSPSYSSQIPVQNGFIDLNNGNMHLEFPLATNPQRGSLALDERLVYDSRVWQIAKNNGYFWMPSNVPNSWGGWRLTTGLETGTVSNVPTDNSIETQNACKIGPRYEYDVTEEWTTYSQFSWTDSTGTTHMFPINTSQPISVCSGDTSHTQPNGSGYALDGSGYYATVTQYQNMVVYDSSGAEVYPQIIDRNGNTFTADSNGNLVDTRGNTPILMSSSGNQVYYDVLGAGGTRQRYTITLGTINFSTAFGQAGVSEDSGSLSTITSISLPDGSSYTFAYDSYAGLYSITLPTGGTETFGYTNYSDGYNSVNRWISSRIRDGATTSIGTLANGACSANSSCTLDTTVTTPAGDQTYYEILVDSGSIANNSSYTQFILPYKGNMNNPGIQLAQFGTTYAQQTEQAADGNFYESTTSITQNTYWDDTEESTQTSTAFTNGYLPSTVSVWDFYNTNNGVPTSPTQTATTTYGYSVNGAGFPTSVVVTDSSGNQITQATYSYDGAAVTATSNLPNHGSASGNRGNLTSLSRWINSPSGSLQTTATYDDAGMLLSSTTPLGTTTYTHDSTDALLHVLTPPTPPSGVSLPVTTNYDASSGVLTSASDPNNSTMSYTNFDTFDRPQQVTYPDTGVENVSYSQVQVTDTRDFDSHSVRSQTQTVVDGYGRLSYSLVSAGSQTYRTDTCYDGNGRVSFVSTPYVDHNGTKVCSGTGLGTVYGYDSLDRLLSVTRPDGTTVIKTYVGGRSVQVTTEGTSRVIQSNVFGQPVTICEISDNTTAAGEHPASCGTDISGTGFVTTYAYNRAGHTTTATQGAQTRTFTADSLGRTLSVVEPESGMTTYAYTYNSTGLQVVRTRPQANIAAAPQLNSIPQTQTTTQYDSLGRVVSVGYNDNSTSSRGFFYDMAYGGDVIQNKGAVKGRMSNAFSLSPGGSLQFAREMVYDSMGRITKTKDCLPGWCNSSAYDIYRTYSYNYASAMEGENYSTTLGTTTPNTSLIYGYNIAGQLTSVGGGQNNAPLAPSIWVASTMAPFGPLVAQFGNALYNVNTYDVAGRVNSGYVCMNSTQEGCPGGTIAYGYIDAIQGNQLTHSGDTVLGQQRDYTYDEFGRLSGLTTSPNSGPVIAMNFQYDRYGNRLQQNVTQGTGTYPQPQLSFTAANNQVKGYSYDVAGNVINDGFHSYGYDAENNLTSIDGGTTVSYAFDALNERVMETTSGGTTRYGFDLGGRRSTQWNSAGSLQQVQYYGLAGKVAYWSSTDGNIHFEHQDWLGTERERTTASGGFDGSYNSLPFGDGATVAGNDTNTGHFALLNQDASSVLSISHAYFREYNASSGRWMSPDPAFASHDLNNPQTLNRYSYALNQPCSLVDPFGLDPCTLNVRVVPTKNSDLGKGNVTQALEQAISSILGNAGVGTNFNSPGDPDYTLVVANSPSGFHLDSGGMGVDPGAGNRGYAFSSPVQTFNPATSRSTSALGTALGRVGAHEFGHYALGAGHSSSGLMTASLPNGSLGNADSSGRYDFTPSQAQAIRALCLKLHPQPSGGGGGGSTGPAGTPIVGFGGDPGDGGSPGGGDTGPGSGWCPECPPSVLIPRNP